MSEYSNSTNIHSYLSEIIASQEYMLRAAQDELSKLEQSENPTPFEALRARAFIHAHAGMHDAAIADLSALASRPDGQIPNILNKLGQALLRRGKEDDFEQVAAISKQVLSLVETTSGERWLAYHNMALSCLARKDLSSAEEYEQKAIDEVDDARSHSVLSFIRSTHVPVAKDVSEFAFVGTFKVDMANSMTLPLSSRVGFLSSMERASI